MCPEFGVNRQKGAGLPIALFVITVLSLIALQMTRQIEDSSNAVSLQVQSQRAFFAAESGAQTAMAQGLASGSCSGFPRTLSFSEAALVGCQASLSCDLRQADLDSDGSNENILTLISSGQCGAGIDQAVRTIEVTLR